MKRRGITLLELLVSMVISAIVIIGAVSSFSVATDYHIRVLPEREEYARRRAFETRLQNLLSRAFVDATGRTYFVIGTPGGGSTGTSDSNEGDSVTFTMRGEQPPGAAMSSTDDFETQHENFGPMGGAVELTLSTTPYGQIEDQSGLFIREQRPSDGDATQGGFESMLDDQIAFIQFEAFDGLQWTTIWDTTLEETPRIPAAIRVTYRLDGEDENASHQMVVRLPLSDVTPENPFETGARS